MNKRVYNINIAYKLLELKMRLLENKDKELRKAINKIRKAYKRLTASRAERNKYKL